MNVREPIDRTGVARVQLACRRLGLSDRETATMVAIHRGRPWLLCEYEAAGSSAEAMIADRLEISGAIHRGRRGAH